MLSAPTFKSFFVIFPVGASSSSAASSFSSASESSNGSPRAIALALASARCLSAFLRSFSSAA